MKKKVQINSGYQKEKIFLSKERTIWSNERTTLSFIRTGLSSFLLGVGMIKLFSDDFTNLGGVLMLGIGFFFIITGLILYPTRKKFILRS